MAPAEPLPTFLIIGAQKSGTHWLRFNLGLHPDVFSANGEIWFFNNRDRYNDLGVDWYRSQFEGWAGEPIVGESTSGYLFWRHHPATVADRIKEVVPQVRLLAILRNPIDRAQSALVHHIEMGALPRDADLLQLVRATPPEHEPLGIISGGWYAASLEPYLRLFGEQVLVLLHDDISIDPRAFYAEATRHVGASPGFVPTGLEQVRHSHQEGPSAEPSRQPLTASQRSELYSYFAEDVARLEAMIGRDLSRWAPHRDESA